MSYHISYIISYHVIPYSLTPIPAYGYGEGSKGAEEGVDPGAS